MKVLVGKHYAWIGGPTEEGVVKKIDEFMDKGWVPLGGVVSPRGGWLYQALVKMEEE